VNPVSVAGNRFVQSGKGNAPHFTARYARNSPWQGPVYHVAARTVQE